jgi:hypothetical protein
MLPSSAFPLDKDELLAISSSNPRNCHSTVNNIHTIRQKRQPPGKILLMLLSLILETPHASLPIGQCLNSHESMRGEENLVIHHGHTTRNRFRNVKRRDQRFLPQVILPEVRHVVLDTVADASVGQISKTVVASLDHVGIFLAVEICGRAVSFDDVFLNCTLHRGAWQE